MRSSHFEFQSCSRNSMVIVKDFFVVFLAIICWGANSLAKRRTIMEKTRFVRSSSNPFELKFSNPYGLLSFNDFAL